MTAAFIASNGGCRYTPFRPNSMSIRPQAKGLARIDYLRRAREWISQSAFQLCNPPIAGLVRRFAFAYASLDYGGAGFIGRHIVEHFHDRAEVRVLAGIEQGPHL